MSTNEDNFYDPYDAFKEKETNEVTDKEKEKQKQERLLELADLTELMGTPCGRRFMWRLLCKTHLYRSSFTGNSVTYLLEGERNIGLTYIGDLHTHCLADYMKMMKENSSNG